MTKDKAWINLMELGARFGCHQMPERSFFIGKYQFPLCARCSGLAIGQLIAFIPKVSGRLPKNPCVAAALIAPTAFDGTTQYIGLQTSNNSRRFITGIMAGIGGISLLKLALTYHDRKVTIDTANVKIASIPTPQQRKRSFFKHEEAQL